MSKVLTISKDSLKEAIDKAKKESKKRNFLQSVELIIAIEGLDLRKPENRIVGSVKLPNPPTKLKKIAAFADGAMAEKLREAGVDAIFSSKNLDEISGSRREARKIAKKYDFFVAEPALMAKIGKVMGFTLGPRGKMPQIITPNIDVKSFIENLRSSVRIYVRNNPMVAVAIGQEDMDSEKLAENALAVIEYVKSKLGDKGKISRIYVKTTMGPTIRVM